MKKLVSIILALAMILALNIPAFAANTSVKINAEGDRDYAAYQLLNVTVSEIKGEHEDCDGTNHVKSCYNYAYTINEDFFDILSAATSKVNETDIIEAIRNAADLQTLANSIYRGIQAANLDAAKYVKFNGPTTNLEQGYWLIADVTEGLTNNANSLVMLDTVGQNEVEINSKTSLPTITKKVLDKDDTAGTEDWVDSADHDINDVVYFKLTATLPNNLSSYEDYTLIFKDTLSPAFTNVDDVTVILKNGNNEEVLADGFVTDKTANGVTVTFENIKAINNVSATSEVIVTYTAKFNGTVVTGNAGNLNTVALEFSNDPYGDSTGEISDKVKVFTYKVVINKVDENLNALEGAGFTLYKKVAGSTEPDEFEVVATINNTTTFEWTGLDAGTYKLVESTVPAGYNKMTDKEFVISATHDEDSEDPQLTALDGGVLAPGDVATGAIETDITNFTGTVLPETGAMGTMWLILGGAMLVVLAGVFMITRKKMSIYED